MNPFSYNNPVIVFLTKAADMLILSLFWFICCIPVVTFVPACAALYASITDVVFGNERGYGVTRYFFSVFTQNFKRGMALSLLCAAVILLMAIGINTGLQVWAESAWGAAYMALGILVVIIFGTALLFIPPTFARFDGKTSVIIRLALYFSSRRVIRSLWYALLLAAVVLSVSIFPLVIVIAPALYVDLIRRGTEKTMNAYKAEYISDGDEEAEESEPTGEAESMSGLNSALSEGEDEDA